MSTNDLPGHFPERPAPDYADFKPGEHAQLLRSDPQRYSDLVRNVTEFGIYLIDRDERVQSWNRGAQNISGYAEAEVLGKPYAALFADDPVREGVPGKAIQFAAANQHCRTESLRRRRDGAVFTAESTLDAIRGDAGEILGYVEVFRDISDQKQREQELYRRATRDSLTGAYNRGHFTELATQEIERAQRFAEPLSLVLVDIDHFKKVNDLYGHAIGDRVIENLVRVCSANLRKIDFIGRVGGEEFGITLPRANKQPAFEMMQRLRLKLAEQRMSADDIEFGYTVSIGLAALRSHTRDFAELIRNADAALYRAKREGRNRVEAWFE